MQQVHKNAQFSLEQNVNYKLVNRFDFIDLLKEKGITISDASREDLELIKNEAITQGMTRDDVEALADSIARDLFTENALGKSLLKGIRHFIKDPITADGVVKKGFLNEIAAYGIRLNGVTGNWGKERNVKNLVTNAGFAGVASRINGSGSVNPFVYIEMGTGTTAAAAGNTALETAITDSGLARVSATASRVTTTQTNDTAQLVTTFTVTGTKAVTESGVLSEAAAGVLLCRQVFSAINVVNGDSLQVTWKIKAA